MVEDNSILFLSSTYLVVGRRGIDRQNQRSDEMGRYTSDVVVVVVGLIYIEAISVGTSKTNVAVECDNRERGNGARTQNAYASAVCTCNIVELFDC